MADYGIKISKPGIDVKTIPSESTIKDFIILDQKNCLLVYQSGIVNSTTTITHNLGYVPMFEGYRIKISDNSVTLLRPDDAEWSIVATTTTLVMTDLTVGANTYNLFYIIFML